MLGRLGQDWATPSLRESAAWSRHTLGPPGAAKPARPERGAVEWFQVVDERNAAPDPEEGRRLRDRHERLLEEGTRLPGVAEVLEVYGRLAPYTSAPVNARVPTRYATGGNP